MLVSPPNFKVVAAVDSVITSAVFSSMLFNFFYYNYSSNCIIEPYSRYYGGSYYWARYIGIE